MAGRFVRASKYRHVFGRPTRKEQCYDNLHISKNAWDSNIIKVNPKYLSVNWEAGGGGAFAVIPLEHKGKLPELFPLFRGHTATVLDTDWSPFNDSLIASSSDDGKVFVWVVPEDFSLLSDDEEPKDISPVSRLTGHSRKVGHVLFNPVAENVLASSSGDFTIKIWDIEQANPQLTLKHPDLVQSLSWSGTGQYMVTTCRDKKLRVWDVRQEKPAHEVPGHAGAKNSRAVWLGELDRVATTGFSRMSDRQLGLWDIRSPNLPINEFETLDSISGVCMPFWDEGTKCLYLAGKGDGNIRYYELENDEFIYLSEYKSTDPQRGIAFVPRRGLNVHENEVMRAYKTVNDSYVEPISFIVPRRAETFQSDIFPEAPSGEPGLTSADWFSGKNAVAPKFDLATLYSEDGALHTQTASSIFSPVATQTPTTATSTAPRKMSVVEHRVEHKRAPTLQAPPSPVKASFAKKETPAVVEPTRSASPVKAKAEMSKPLPISVPETKPAALDTLSTSPTISKSPMPMKQSYDNVNHQLDHITQLLEAQTMTIVSQNVLISELARDIENIKNKVGGDDEKDKYIKKLEAELEAAKRASPRGESPRNSPRESKAFE